MTLKGKRVRFVTTHVLQTVTFTARVVKDNGDGTVWVEMPERVRNLKFAPLDGKRYGLYKVSDLHFV